jgi:hypothetical protein
MRGRRLASSEQDEHPPADASSQAYIAAVGVNSCGDHRWAHVAKSRAVMSLFEG